eukprot:scaffold298675_cov23-Prasinocladus_malaysianus.AAC.2
MFGPAFSCGLSCNSLTKYFPDIIYDRTLPALLLGSIDCAAYILGLSRPSRALTEAAQHIA